MAFRVRFDVFSIRIKNARQSSEVTSPELKEVKNMPHISNTRINILW